MKILNKEWIVKVQKTDTVKIKYIISNFKHNRERSQYEKQLRRLQVQGQSMNSIR